MAEKGQVACLGDDNFEGGELTDADNGYFLEISGGKRHLVANYNSPHWKNKLKRLVRK